MYYNTKGGARIRELRIAKNFTQDDLAEHKLAPIISPGKTVEGGLGGMVSSVILMSLIASLYSQCAGVEIRYGWLFLYLFLASIIGQFGDLAMSTIKRTVGIKDFSRVLPGHGAFWTGLTASCLPRPLRCSTAI